MKIVIPGGTGQVGAMLARRFAVDGHDVVVLSRGETSLAPRVVTWDAKMLGAWQSEIDGADVVINLTGRNVNCRYNSENRRQIMDSRINSTRVVGKAIAAAANPPKVWLQASTATIYAHRFDEANDEISGLIGGGEADAPDKWRFSIEVAKAWEQAANEADTPRTRKVLMRSAMTMSPDAGGIFDVLLGLVQMGLGGTAGRGDQYISWIHDSDFINSVYWLIEHDQLAGPINLSSPNPLPNKEFMRVLRKAAGARIGLPAAEWMLAIGAVFMRTETELILKSRRVVPTRMLKSGFEFAFPNWEDAARNLVSRRKQK